MIEIRYYRVCCGALLGGVIIAAMGFIYSSKLIDVKDVENLDYNRWRPVPLEIHPERYLEGAISRDDLQAVALAVVPRWKVPKVSAILHALRLWGVSSNFSDDQLTTPSRSGILSGSQMLQICLDDRKLHELLASPCESILYRTPVDIGVRYGNSSSPGHCDQFLKVTAELGLPSATPVCPPGGKPGTLNDVIRNSLRTFVIEQELEFTAVAYSRLLPPNDRWTNRYGETTTFCDLAHALLKKPIGQGACHGTHVPYALVNLLRANAYYHILDHATVENIEKRLTDISLLLESHQTKNGGWLGDWAGSSSQSESKDSQDSFGLIYSTGHHLEWIALAPDHVRPPRNTVFKAAQLLSQLIPQHDVVTISNPKSYGMFTHAARALMLLNRAEPSVLISR